MLYEQELDLVLQEITTRWDIPGLAVGIGKIDEIVYARGFGVQNVVHTGAGHAGFGSLRGLHFQSLRRHSRGAVAEQRNNQPGCTFVELPPYFRLDDGRHPLLPFGKMLSHTSGCRIQMRSIHRATGAS